MAFLLFHDHSLTVTLRHVEGKPNGSFQYRRRIPVLLRGHYPGKSFYVRSLGRDPNELARKAADLTAQLDGLWSQIRADANSIEAKGNAGDKGGVNVAQNALQIIVDHLIRVRAPHLAGMGERGIASQAKHASPETHRDIIHLSSALALYLSHHPKGELKKFKTDAERVVNNVVALVGDLPLSRYTRQQAQEYRDDLLTRNSTATVRRRLDTLVAVFNKAVAEEGLTLGNPFENLSIPQEGRDAEKREAYTNAELFSITRACRRLDDDIRHIIALQMDTGARAGEIIGLRIMDVILDHPIPHVCIRPVGTVRTLKTPASEREIPLVGEALWAAERALEARRKAEEPGSWLFPRYASDKEIKATHASNTLNKWLRGLEGVCDQKTTHCFRHAFRDRLRAAQVPLEIQDCLGGWGSRSVGQGYGSGYPLQVLAEHMSKLMRGE